MPLTRRTRLERRRAAGLVLSAVVATAILAAVPERPPTPEEARADRRAHATRLGVQELEAAIAQYRRDHGALPGRLVAGDLTAQPSESLFVRQLTRASDVRGACAPGPEPGFPFGPYLPAGLPINPDNELSSVRFAPRETQPDGSTGWSVDPTDGSVWSNAAEAEDER